MGTFALILFQREKRKVVVGGRVDGRYHDAVGSGAIMAMRSCLSTLLAKGVTDFSARTTKCR